MFEFLIRVAFARCIQVKPGVELIKSGWTMVRYTINVIGENHQDDIDQCGFYPVDQSKGTTTFLKFNVDPVKEEIKAAMNGNLCRRVTY